MKKWIFKLIRWFFNFLIKDRLRLSQIFIKNITSAMIVVSWKIIDDVDISLPCRKLQKSHKDASLDTIYQLFSSFLYTRSRAALFQISPIHFCISFNRNFRKIEFCSLVNICIFSFFHFFFRLFFYNRDSFVQMNVSL